MRCSKTDKVSKGTLRFGMTYWFCAINEETWRITRDRNLWGVGDWQPALISGIKENDRVVFYIIGEAFGGTFEVISAPYINEKEFFTGKLYPNCVKLEARIIPEKPKVPTSECIKELEFLRNKNIWSVHLIGRPVLPIPIHDYLIIEQFLKWEVWP